MMVQWCIKGLSLDDDAAAEQIMTDQRGLLCQWWLNSTTFPPLEEIPAKLTRENLLRHVNQFTGIDPSTGEPFNEASPFSSLSAGSVERDLVLATNTVHTARRTAIYFGSQFGAADVAYLYLCWLVVAPRESVPIKGVAEEVRDLHTYRDYSDFQLEGEITAKLDVPATQISCCEKWERQNGSFWCKGIFPNPIFTPPETLSNIRTMI